MQTETIKKHFLKRFETYGYRVLANAPLITNDPTLFFVNASITPFKPEMIQGLMIENTVNIQTCFRARLKPDLLLVFEMLGIITNIGEVQMSLGHFLEFLSKDCRIPVDRLHAVVNATDQDLCQLCDDYLKPDSVQSISGDTVKYKTRWEYGKAVPLRGRGMTLVYQNHSAVQCERLNCGIYCPCSRYLPIGNVIIVENDRTKKCYVEFGFGVEFLAALQFNGDLFQIDKFAARLKDLNAAGLSDEDARLILNLVDGIDALLAAGCVPGSKGSSYVLRFLIRRLVDTILKQREFHEASSQVSALLDLLSIVNTGPILCEVAHYCRSIESNLKHAAKYLKKNAVCPITVLRGELHATYGLSGSIADDLLTRTLTGAFDHLDREIAGPIGNNFNKEFLMQLSLMPESREAIQA